MEAVAGQGAARRRGARSATPPPIQLGLVFGLVLLALVAWLVTDRRMDGMDGGPGTDLGSFGFYVTAWVVMMAAMMFPSVAPTVALYAQMARRRAPVAPLLFAAGYLVTWAAAGLLAYGLFAGGRAVLGDELTWDGAGRWIAGSTLVVAAAYELTPLKDVCLSKCRRPVGFLVGSWRDGLSGALEMGARHGAWCVGCCWALMASLFALGVMSLAWMAFVAVLIALEKILPWGRAATYGTAALLLALGVMLLAAPDAIPGLTLPDSGGMDSMRMMS